MLRFCHHKSDIGILWLRPGLGGIDHLKGRIDTNYNRASLGKLHSELPVAATYVEDPAALDVAHEFEDQLMFEPLGYGAEF